MAIEIKLVVDGSAVALLHSLPGRSRNELWAFIQTFVPPPQRGDDQIIDETGRVLEMSHFKKFTVIWWFDSPVWEVKVVKIVRNPNS